MSSVVVLADSIGPNFQKEHRLITIKAKFWRCLVPQLLKHRWFSTNSESSRAVPTSKKLRMNYYCPKVFGKRASGMQSKGYLSPLTNFIARTLWYSLYKVTCLTCWMLAKLGCAKQWSNRPLESFTETEVIITGTYEAWQHFFKLRLPDDVQPEMRLLAEQCKEAIENSVPNVLQYGENHLPYDVGEDKLFLIDGEIRTYTLQERKQIAIGKIAGVSYVNDTENEKAIKLGLKLKDNNPPHLSPYEMVAECRPYGMKYANFNGWMSERYKLENTGPYTKEMEDDQC